MTVGHALTLTLSTQPNGYWHPAGLADTTTGSYTNPGATGTVESEQLSATDTLSDTAPATQQKAPDHATHAAQV